MQDYGLCVFNRKSRFADITVICTVYIQMSSKKNHQNLWIVRVCRSEHLFSFYRLKSNYSLHFFQLPNIRLQCLRFLGGFCFFFVFEKGIFQNKSQIPHQDFLMFF